MSTTTEDRLYELMALAGQHQAAVQSALEGLAMERAALVRERVALEATRTALTKAMKDAVVLATRTALDGAVDTATTHLMTQTRGLQGGLDRMQAQVERLEHWLRRLGSWASWRLLGRGLAAMVLLMLLGGVAGTTLLWWNDSALQAALTQKAQLETEIAALKTTHDQWAAQGLLGKLITCRPLNRPCIAVDEKAGPFTYHGDDYRIIQGY